MGNESWCVAYYFTQSTTNRARVVSEERIRDANDTLAFTR